MEVYTYENLEAQACQSYIYVKVAESLMTDKSLTGSSIPSNHNWLKLWFENVLSAGDKTILDGVVSDSLGKYRVVKPRGTIMRDILIAASDSTQLGRLLNALDAYPSMVICLDNLNYVLARVRVEKVYQDEVITLADRDLVLATIPEEDFAEL